MKRRIPRRVTRWRLSDGREVSGCRDLGCYCATLGRFCATHAAMLQPVAIDR